MPYPMPVVGSADSPSVAHNDPYQLFIAVATSTCQSEAPSHPRQRIWWKWWERQRQKEMAIRPIWSIYGLNHCALMPLVHCVCVGFLSASINGKWRRSIDRERHLRHQEQRKRYKGKNRTKGAKTTGQADDEHLLDAHHVMQQVGEKQSEDLPASVF